MLLVWLRPELLFGYALVLLPLLLAGPLASRHLRGGQAILAAGVAGATSGVLALASLAFGSQVLDTYVWVLVGPLSMPPVPEIPHLAYLPDWLMTWGQQDVLVAQPVEQPGRRSVGAHDPPPRTSDAMSVGHEPGQPFLDRLHNTSQELAGAASCTTTNRGAERLDALSSLLS